MCKNLKEKVSMLGRRSKKKSEMVQIKVHYVRLTAD